MKKTKKMKALYAQEEKMFNRILKSYEYDQLMKVQLLIILEDGKPKHSIFVDPNHKFCEFAECE